MAAYTVKLKQKGYPGQPGYQSSPHGPELKLSFTDEDMAMELIGYFSAQYPDEEFTIKQLEAAKLGKSSYRTVGHIKDGSFKEPGRSKQYA